MGLLKIFTANPHIHIIASYSLHALIKRIFFHSFYVLCILTFTLAFDL